MKLLFSILFTCIIVYKVAFDNIKKSASDNIKNGSLQYSEELGWINWDHAKKSGTIKSFSVLKYLNENAMDSFSFQYSQKMKHKIGHFEAVAEVIESRKMQCGQTPEELKFNFLQIFKSTSISFENMQALFPNSRNSSDREGDIVGNLISFYLAINDLNREEIEKQLTLCSETESLDKLNTSGIGFCPWSNVFIENKTQQKAVKELSDLLNCSNLKDSSINTIHQVRNLYIKDLPYARVSIPNYIRLR